METLGYSLGGGMVEAANLTGAVLALVVILSLSIEIGVGLFTEQLAPEGS